MTNRITPEMLLELEREADRARDFLARSDDMTEERGCPYTLGYAEQSLRALITAADAVTEKG